MFTRFGFAVDQRRSNDQVKNDIENMISIYQQWPPILSREHGVFVILSYLIHERELTLMFDGFDPIRTPGIELGFIGYYLLEMQQLLLRLGVRQYYNLTARVYHFPSVPPTGNYVHNQATSQESTLGFDYGIFIKLQSPLSMFNPHEGITLRLRQKDLLATGVATGHMLHDAARITTALNGTLTDLINYKHATLFKAYRRRDINYKVGAVMPHHSEDAYVALFSKFEKLKLPVIKMQWNGCPALVIENVNDPEVAKSIWRTHRF